MSKDWHWCWRSFICLLSCLCSVSLCVIQFEAKVERCKKKATLWIAKGKPDDIFSSKRKARLEGRSISLLHLFVSFCCGAQILLPSVSQARNSNYCSLKLRLGRRGREALDTPVKSREVCDLNAAGRRMVSYLALVLLLCIRIPGPHRTRHSTVTKSKGSRCSHRPRSHKVFAYVCFSCFGVWKTRPNGLHRTFSMVCPPGHCLICWKTNRISQNSSEDTKNKKHEKDELQICRNVDDREVYWPWW